MEQQAEEYKNSKKMNECIAYFKERSVYEQLFLKMREKYISLGRIGGTVRLSELKKEECRQLSGFFQKDFEGGSIVSISATAMEKALAGSKFAGLKWEDILQSYFQEKFMDKKQQKQKELQEREEFFAGILEKVPTGVGYIWLVSVLETQTEGYTALMKQYRERPDTLRIQLELFLKAVSQLPFFVEKKERMTYKLLPMFAAETTGNPHFFDVGTLGEQLLICFLKMHIFDYKEKGVMNAEEKANLLYEAGLLKDDLSNNTLAYGIHAIDVEGKVHEGIEGFLKRKEPILLTLKTLTELQQVKTQGRKCVYMVENPAIFSKLVECWPTEAILCGNGQLRLATLVLLDLFETETEFWYAGDFDPEGFGIAQRMKERYGKRVHLWKYNREFYEKYQSEVEISSKSLKKLDRIYLEELQEIKEVMLKQKKAAYQETMLAEYLK